MAAGRQIRVCRLIGSRLIEVRLYTSERVYDVSASVVLKMAPLVRITQIKMVVKTSVNLLIRKMSMAACFNRVFKFPLL